MELVTGQIVNFTAQGRSGCDKDEKVKFCSENGIHVEGNNVTVQCSNIRLQTFGNNCIRVASPGTVGSIIAVNEAFFSKQGHHGLMITFRTKVIDVEITI
ncbi:hypothetical protein H7F28_08685 [Brevibacterium sp. PAMC23299]|nr:hypothetical protein H7F28_08685 [Brevibacterium sp. PAMC23299]